MVKLSSLVLRFLLFSEAVQPVKIDKKYKKIKWHVTNNNIFQLQQRVSNALKYIQNFNYTEQKENQFPLVFAVFSHLTSLVFIKDRPVSSGCFVFDLGVFVFEFLGASFSRFGCFVFEFWVLRFRDLGASCFGLRFRNYRKTVRISTTADFHKL